MKNQILSLMLLLVVVLSFTNCKKKDTTEDIVEPVVVTNPAPVGGDYWLTTMPYSQNNSVFWTQDFETFHELSTDLKSATQVFLMGDTLIVNCNSKIYYGSATNPSGFKSISSSMTASKIGYINGILVATSVDGNNYYVGYCNTKKGETSINYTFLSSINYSDFKYVRNTLITNITTGMGSTGAFSYFSNDSLKWMATTFPFSNGKYYDGSNNMIIGFDGNIHTTSDIDLNTATWNHIYVSGNYTNNSDSSGNFMSSSYFNINNEWKVYGTISSSITGNTISAVNVSTDQGATWQTTLLTGITYEHYYDSYTCFVSKTTTFMVGQSKVYKSTDGINFTQILSGTSADEFYSATSNAVYVK